MEEKGLLTAVVTVFSYPLITLFGLLVSAIMYPIAVFAALLDPNTP